MDASAEVGSLTGFDKRPKIRRTPPPSAPPVMAGEMFPFERTGESETPKRGRETMSPASPEKQAKRTKRQKPQRELVKDLESLIDGLIAVCIEKKPAVRHINQSMKDTLMSIKEIQIELSEQMEESEVVIRRTATQTTPGLVSYSQVAREANTRGPEPEKSLPGWNKVRTRTSDQKAPKKKNDKPIKRARPDALIIKGTEGHFYSEILNLVTRREDNKLEDVRKNVRRIKRTAKGDLLLELDGASRDDTQSIKESIGNVLGDRACVRTVVEEAHVEIRDLDELTTKEEVAAAVHALTGHQVDASIVKALRPAYAGSRMAVLALVPLIAAKLLSEGRVKVGWSNCRVRERAYERRCYKCLEFGHIAFRCKSGVDRSDCCLKCGQPGHKVADCSQEPKCFLCDRAKKADVKHIAGSRRCPMSKKSSENQTVREIQADVALISEPYKKTPGPNYILDAEKCAAILTIGSSRPQQVRVGSYYIRAMVNELFIYSCYLPPRLSLAEFTSVLDKLVDDARGKRNVIIAGDFNAWAEEWGSVYTNPRGKTLLETFASLDVALLNTGSEHTFRRGGAGSVVDLSFCSSSLFQQARWRLGEVYSASDHKAIILEIMRNRPAAAAPAHSRFNPKTLQEDAFHRAWGDPGMGENAESSAEKLMGVMATACRASMRETRSHHRNLEPVYWWSGEIAAARSDFVTLYSRYQHRVRSSKTTAAEIQKDAS
ncbi:uncharacterized protein [Drosophila takahashii]|uniref:uncharacterized protein n=1 Tax=Drosophila takahashii TaxID=29030 RepID=UPI003899445D